MTKKTDIIKESIIRDELAKAHNEDAAKVKDILEKALALKGLSAAEAATLCAVRDEALVDALYKTACRVKEAVYGRRLVLFAPLYVSNLCKNECLYCAFRATNTTMRRRALSQDEIADEVRALVDQGHKRVLLVAGPIRVYMSPATSGTTIGVLPLPTGRCAPCAETKSHAAARICLPVRK